MNTNARSSAAEEFEAGNRFGGRGSVVCVISDVGKHDFRRVEVEIGVKRAGNEIANGGRTKVINLRTLVINTPLRNGLVKDSVRADYKVSQRL